MANNDIPKFGRIAIRENVGAHHGDLDSAAPSQQLHALGDV